MALTEAEYQEHRRAAGERHRRRERAKRDTAAGLSHLVQAEVPIKQLTTDERWNYFLSLLQAKLEASRAQVAAVQAEGLDAPREMSFETLAERHTRALTWQARVDTLEEITAIPSDILAGAAAQKADAEEK
ncbi:MAG: hypothetical protein ACYSUN_03285 [Planctomycetota bacterium]|jgi:hypothetical protein